MNSVVIPNSEWEDILNALVAALAPWNGGKLHLFKTNVTPSPAMVIGDLVEADFTGYAASTAVVWGAAAFLPDGTAVVVGDAKTFETGSPSTVLNTIYGWYFTDSAGTTLLFARKLDNPIALSGPSQIITILPTYPAYLSQ